MLAERAGALDAVATITEAAMRGNWTSPSRCTGASRRWPGCPPK